MRIPVGQGFAGRIAAERVPIFIADVDHADVLNPILREKGIASLLGVPLIVEGDLIGVLHVGSLTPRTFGQDDLAVLQMAAARAAPAIERARLFAELEHEHDVSMVLQRSLLPKRLAEVVGVNVAARYLPAREEVGGDWYDVIELPRGRVGVVIGDVVGHGIAAAALMGRLRTALHSYAIEGHGPGRTLELVDRFVQSLNESAMATAGLRGVRHVHVGASVCDRRTPPAARDLGLRRAGARGHARAPAGSVPLRPVPRARAVARKRRDAAALHRRPRGAPWRRLERRHRGAGERGERRKVAGGGMRAGGRQAGSARRPARRRGDRRTRRTRRSRRSCT